MCAADALDTVLADNRSTRGRRGGTMRWRGRRQVKRGRTATLLLVIAIAGATACTGSGSKAGGELEPVVLRLADWTENPAFEPAVAYFEKRVDELSGGQLRVEDVQGWGDLEPDSEQRIVRDVAAGKADLGWVGTRVFDTLGVTTFQALTAPMLIDSYPLERAVIASTIPSEMLNGLDVLDLTGLAVFGDGLRKPISQDRPLMAPSDWRGETFNVFRSAAETAAIAALGAEPTDVFADRTGYTAAERNLLIYKDNYVTRFRYVTANVNLWPQTVALFANPDTLARLTSEERAWLQNAATDAAARSTGFFDHDQDIVPFTCARGARYAQASEADLSSLRRAFDGIYADLERDPQTGAFIEQIEAQKDALPATPALQIPADCLSSSAEPPTGDPLAGTWQTEHLTESQIVQAFIAAGGTESEGHAFFADEATQFLVITLDFEHGALIEYGSADGGPPVIGDNPSYSIDGSTLTLSAPGCTATFSATISGERLRLRLISPWSGDSLCVDSSPYGTTIYASFPFTRVP
jgi:TRAP-type C4-dicarboxylate transport system substrate-binding protein